MQTLRMRPLFTKAGPACPAITTTPAQRAGAVKSVFVVPCLLRALRHTRRGGVGFVPDHSHAITQHMVTLST
ncbi:MAG: hypothetical protein ACHP7P_15655, partial [Terriglobales bacterium]